MFDGRIISGITVFVAVAEAGSYVRAAQRVGLSRSGIGKAIGRLENRTGMRLFDRTSRALKLTEEGRAFFDEVSPLLQRLGQAAAPANTAEVRGHLRLSCDAAFGAFLMIPALPSLFEQHPQLKLDLLIRDRIGNLLKDGIDVAVRFGEPEFKNLDKRLLLWSRVVTCATPEYVSHHGEPARPEDILDGHNCIRLLDDVTGKPHAWHFENAAGDVREIVSDCALIVNDAPSVMAAIRSSFGIARALDFMVEDDIRAGRLVEILPEWNRRMWPAYIYTPQRSHVSAAMEAFKAFVASHPFESVRARA